MSHEVEVTGNAVVATLSGTLDGKNARALVTSLRDHLVPGATIVLEMSGIDSVDVEGITQLVMLKRRAEKKLVLAAPSYEVIEALRRNDLESDFDIAPSRAAALGATGGAPSHYAEPPSFGGPPPPYDAPPSFGGPPSFAPDPVAPEPAYIPTDPPPFNPVPSHVPRIPDAPPPRREEVREEANEWVTPAARADRPPPPQTIAPAYGSPPPQKKSGGGKGWLWFLLLLLLGGGGYGGWWYWQQMKKPEIVAGEKTWTGAEGTDVDFEIKFKNAETLVLKDGVLPKDLFLEETLKSYADGVKSQSIHGTALAPGEYTVSFAAKPTDGEAGEAKPFTFKITAAPVTDASGGKLRELTAGVPLKAGAQELVRGCVSATGEKLDGTGLTVKVDTASKLATLTGTPVKEGDLAFSVAAKDFEGKTQTFNYKVKVNPSPQKTEEEQKRIAQQLAEQKAAAEKLAAEKEAEKKRAEEQAAAQKKAEEELAAQKLAGEEQKQAEKKLADEKLAEQKRAEKKMAEQKRAEKELAEKEEKIKASSSPEEALDPDMLIMLNQRIARSPFPEEEKIKMRAAVNEVRWAEKLATVPFGHNERSIAPSAKQALLEGLASSPHLKKPGAREEMEFVVVGYASTSGSRAKNVELSKARAAAVTSLLRSSEFAIEPKFTGDYGGTNVLGPSEDDNRVVEVYAVKVTDRTSAALRKLLENMQRVSGVK